MSNLGTGTILYYEDSGGRGGGDSEDKISGVLVVSFRGKNRRFGIF